MDHLTTSGYSRNYLWSRARFDLRRYLILLGALVPGPASVGN